MIIKVSNSVKQMFLSRFLFSLPFLFVCDPLFLYHFFSLPSSTPFSFFLYLIYFIHLLVFWDFFFFLHHFTLSSFLRSFLFSHQTLFLFIFSSVPFLVPSFLLIFSFVLSFLFLFFQAYIYFFASFLHSCPTLSFYFRFYLLD